MYPNKILGLLVAISIAAFTQTSFAAEDVSSIARGGRLYDKWFKVIGAPKPENTHPTPRKKAMPHIDANPVTVGI